LIYIYIYIYIPIVILITFFKIHTTFYLQTNIIYKENEECKGVLTLGMKINITLKSIEFKGEKLN